MKVGLRTGDRPAHDGPFLKISPYSFFHEPVLNLRHSGTRREKDQ